MINAPTVFGTLSHVFLSRNTAAFVNAAQIWSTPLKLCKQRQISATAVHFSMAATLACKFDLLWRKAAPCYHCRLLTYYIYLQVYCMNVGRTLKLSLSTQDVNHHWNVSSLKQCARLEFASWISSMLGPETLWNTIRKETIFGEKNMLVCICLAWKKKKTKCDVHSLAPYVHKNSMIQKSHLFSYL